MTIPFQQGKLEAHERQAILEEVYQQAKGAATAAVKAVVEALLEAELTAKLGREKGAVRHISALPRTVDWVCGQCGCADAQYFTRDGHYRRNLQTGWGSIEGLRVPMLECQQCGHDVICHFTVLEKYERFWLDLDQDVVLGSGLCESLRHLSERWSEAVGSSIGLRTLNERINQIAPLLSPAHHTRITQVPAVIQFDGIWVRLQVPTGTVKPDRRQRRRPQHKGKRMVLLVALGLWTDESGRREILDWELAEGETQPDWQRLLDRLWERGVRPEAGLQAVIRDGKGELGAAVALVYGTRMIEQRCVFHKLRNVADKAREDKSGEVHRELREQLLEQASAIYQAETAAQARERLSSFVHTWGEQAPKAVATLQRDFEQTIAFYTLGCIARELVRTTSLLERTNRELRRKFRQACCFSSRRGAEVAIYLQVQRFHARWTKTSWAQTARSLSLALY
jgi:transposase-like protein